MQVYTDLIASNEVHRIGVTYTMACTFLALPKSPWTRRACMSKDAQIDYF